MKFFNLKKIKLKDALIVIVTALFFLFLGYKTQQRLSPSSTEGVVIEMEALPAPSEPLKSGLTAQSIYESHCAACHDTGAASAPKIGDKAEWSSRISKGTPLLLRHVIEGYNLMPPKGACLQCSDTDLQMAVDYMVKKS